MIPFQFALTEEEYLEFLYACEDSSMSIKLFDKIFRAHQRPKRIPTQPCDHAAVRSLTDSEKGDIWRDGIEDQRFICKNCSKIFGNHAEWWQEYWTTRKANS